MHHAVRCFDSKASPVHYLKLCKEDEVACNIEMHVFLYASATHSPNPKNAPMDVLSRNCKSCCTGMDMTNQAVAGCVEGPCNMA